MNEQKKSVGAKFAQLAKGARNLGLLILGLGIYLGMLVLIVWVLLKGVGAGKLGVGEAVAYATFGTTMLHWMLLSCSV